MKRSVVCLQDDDVLRHLWVLCTSGNTLAPSDSDGPDGQIDKKTDKRVSRGTIEKFPRRGDAAGEVFARSP